MAVIINGSTGIDLPAPLSVAEGGTGLTSVGTNGQILQSTGSALQFASLPAQTMTLISTKTASASSSLEWTGLSGYNTYIMYINNLVMSSTSYGLSVNLGYGSTPTYITSGYVYTLINAYDNAGTSMSISSSASNGSYFQCCAGSAVGATEIPSGFIVLTMNNARPAFNSVMYSSRTAASSVWYTNTAGGFVSNTNPITAIKLSQFVSTLTSGNVSLYGITS